jgi:hypothetical protein
LEAQTYIAPNPSNGRFNLKSSGWDQDKVEVTVISALGATVVYQQYPVVNQQLNAQIDLSAQAPGVYYVRVRAGNRQTLGKVLLGK